MKRIALILVVFAPLLGAASASEENAMTAGDLHELCNGTDHVSKNACRIYILGITQGIAVGLQIADGKTNGGRPCVPESVSGDALEQKVKAKLDADLAASPAKRNLDASAFIAAVVASAYPCSAAPSSPQH
ncbi:MAG TPA: Rap1a/Tai family immunity protein [Steroidobacteraceae bacterium]|nr:Rap1a/Tai family immunity protein [Steroidobacteraceae bacterium]